MTKYQTDYEKENIMEKALYLKFRVDHGSMGHGSWVRWVTWVMGHGSVTHDP